MDLQQTFASIESGLPQPGHVSRRGAEDGASLAPAPIDRNLEKLLASLDEAFQKNDSKDRWALLRELRALTHDPAVVLAIAERIILLPSAELRDYLLASLPETLPRNICCLLDLDRTTRQISRFGGNFYSIYGDEAQLITTLADGRNHPVLAPRVAEFVLRQERVAKAAALALQGTTNEAALSALKAALAKGIKQEDPRGLDYVPLALKGSSDTEAQQLIIRAFEHTPSAGWSTVRCSAARALGGITSPEVLSLLEDSLMQPFEDFDTRIAVAEAIREQRSGELNSRLLPLISAGTATTAWILAGYYSSGFLNRLARFAYLLSSRVTGDIRVQAACALRDSQPELAHRVFQEILNNDDSALWPCSREARIFVRALSPAILEARHARLVTTQPASERGSAAA